MTLVNSMDIGQGDCSRGTSGRIPTTVMQAGDKRLQNQTHILFVATRLAVAGTATFGQGNRTHTERDTP